MPAPGCLLTDDPTSPQTEKRRAPRREVPVIEIEIDGQRLRASNWSSGGSLLEGYVGTRAAGDTVQITIYFPAADPDHGYAAEAEVVRVLRSSRPGPGAIALRFAEFTAADLVTLATNLELLKANSQG